MTWVDVAGWLLHFVTIGYSWRFLVVTLGRVASPGQASALWLARAVLLVATFFVPIVSLWAIAPAGAYRRGMLAWQVKERHLKSVGQHAADVEYWRDQLASEDPVAARNARALLDLWEVDTPKDRG